MRKQFIDFKAIHSHLMQTIDRHLSSWLPGGILQGNEYVSLNPRRSDAHFGSFKINITTGRWADFATGDKGSDLISLYAYINNISQYSAASKLAKLGGVR